MRIVTIFLIKILSPFLKVPLHSLFTKIRIRPHINCDDSQIFIFFKSINFNFKKKRKYILLVFIIEKYNKKKLSKSFKRDNPKFY